MASQLHEKSSDASFTDWIKLQNDEVRENSTVVTNKTLGQDYFLHIDKNPIPLFWPMMPRSAREEEDNTVPRITVSPHILGCFVGYCSPGEEQSRAHIEFTAGADEPNTSDPFRGGYLIHSIKFKHALCIKNKLVPSAEESDEHWLVTYDEDTKEYPSTSVGKLFIGNVEQIAVSGAAPKAKTTLYIEVTHPDGLLLTRELFLPTGYHSVKLDWEHLGVPEEPDNNGIEVVSLNKKEYDSLKRVHATLLNHNDAPEPVAKKNDVVYAVVTVLGTHLKPDQADGYLVGHVDPNVAINAFYQKCLADSVTKKSNGVSTTSNSSAQYTDGYPNTVFLCQVEKRVPDGWKDSSDSARTVINIPIDRVISAMRVSLKNWVLSNSNEKAINFVASVNW